jgi:hypothetical protein
MRDGDKPTMRDGGDMCSFHPEEEREDAFEEHTIFEICCGVVALQLGLGL